MPFFRYDSGMKRLFIIPLIVIALIFSVPTALPASAEGDTYAVADSRDVWFYSARNDESKLFLLPYTYYVRVLEQGTEYSAVEYLVDEAPFRKLTGYCKTDKLTFVDFVPERPYLFREVTLTYSLDDSSSLLGSGNFYTVQRTFVYYGLRYAGSKMFYYVLSDGVFDYVSAREEPEYELNTDYLKPAVSEEPEPEPEPARGLTGVQIAMICIGCVALVAVAVFLLRGKPSPASELEAEPDF